MMRSWLYIELHSIYLLIVSLFKEIECNINHQNIQALGSYVWNFGINSMNNVFSYVSQLGQTSNHYFD